MGILDGSITRWANIDGELILYVFLPALIFGEAMNLNWYQAKGGFIPAVLLAGPGVVIGAFVMGTICYYCMPFGWNWNVAMLFGSIMSPTDTVAVVSLLKEAGASSKLTILIIGESLMNDGTAILLFTMFYNLLEGQSYDIAGIVEFFTAMTIGSCMLGAAFGILSVRFLRVLNR
jgi:NhaP-type Na+/H+ or K+/H+ antiporter